MFVVVGSYTCTAYAEVILTEVNGVRGIFLSGQKTRWFYQVARVGFSGRWKSLKVIPEDERQLYE